MPCRGIIRTATPFGLRWVLLGSGTRTHLEESLPIIIRREILGVPQEFRVAKGPENRNEGRDFQA